MVVEEARLADIEIDVVTVLSAISKKVNLAILKLLAVEGTLTGECVRNKTKIDRNRQSESMSCLLKAGLIRRSNGCYRLTSLGKILHNTVTVAENAVCANWRLKLVDGIDDFEYDKRAKVIDSVIKDKQIMKLLLERSPSTTSSTNKIVSENQRKKTNVGKTVVIVDNEADCVSAYKSVLLKEGYAVYGFTDPYKALETVSDFYNSNKKIDLSILDIKIPGLNGLQVFKVLKSIDRDMKTLFVSALYDAEELLKVYPDDEKVQILKKPVVNEDLTSKVKQILIDNSFPNNI